MKKIIIAVAAAALASTAAYAVADISVTNGVATGFVGKGDVQTIFNLKNAQMQPLHSTVVFDLDLEVSGGSYVCEWTTGEGTKGQKDHTVTKKMKGSLTASLVSDGKKTGQWTGWHITGGDLVTSGEGLKEVGDSCLGNGAEGEVIAVTPADGTAGTTGGLYATIGADRRQLNPLTTTIVIN
jgi:hypothetical protein